MKTRKIRLCLALTACNLLFIWGNSMLTGEASGSISGGLMARLAVIFGSWPGGERLLRKMGHFSEFACLGMLLSWLWLLLEEKDYHRFTMPLLCGLLAACADETIQVFVPNRGPSVLDVWIDAAGVCVGITACQIGYNLIKKKRKQ